MIQRGESYDEVYGGFRWKLPGCFNIGVTACDRHATGDGRLALIYEAPDGRVDRFSFDDLKRLSNRCANALAAMGVRPGDRVGVLLPQRPETAIAHIAVYKLGAVALPLFTQFGPDALEHRLGDSGASSLRGGPERCLQPERHSNQRGVPDYVESQQGESAGQCASEEGRGQPSQSQRGKCFADPHHRQSRACGIDS